jgi:hypothetical protein
MKTIFLEKICVLFTCYLLVLLSLSNLFILRTHSAECSASLFKTLCEQQGGRCKIERGQVCICGRRKKQFNPEYELCNENSVKKRENIEEVISNLNSISTAMESQGECIPSPELCKISKFNSKNDWLASLGNDLYFKREKKIREIESCRKVDRSTVKCTQPVLDYLKNAQIITNNINEHSYGLSISDDEYLEKANLFVGLDSLPSQVKAQKFLEKLQEGTVDNPSRFKGIKEELKEVNQELSPDEQWHFIAFDQSGTAPGFDSFGKRGGRGIFYIPSEYFKSKHPKKPAMDLFLQYSVRPKEQDKEYAHQFSALAVVTKVNGDKEYFIRDHWRSEESDKSHVLSSRRLGGGGGNPTCSKCHISGPIGIHPPNYPDPAEGVLYSYPKRDPFEALEFFNEKISNLNASTDSPNGVAILGDNKGDNGKAFAECLDQEKGNYGLSAAPRETLDRIIKASNCASCHRAGGSRQPIYLEPFNSKTMVDYYIRHQLMPPNSTLELSEGMLLQACLYRVADTQLKNRLTGTSCE